MSAETTRILERVRKLIALANDAGATEGERDNAIRMAHSTLAKYNLSMKDVQEHERGKDDPRVTQEFEAQVQEVWTRRAAHGIAELFFCEYFTRLHSGKHVLVGRTLNVMTAQYITQYVVDSIAKEALAAEALHFGANKLATIFGQPHKVKDGHASRQEWYRAFCQAAATTVYKRCQALIRDASKQVDAAPGTALVLANLYITEQEANARLLPTTLRTGRSSREVMLSSARAAGRAFGEKVSLNRQISGSSTKLLGDK